MIGITKAPPDTMTFGSLEPVIINALSIGTTLYINLASNKSAIKITTTITIGIMTLKTVLSICLCPPFFCAYFQGTMVITNIHFIYFPT